MPSSSISLFVIGAEPGYWILRGFVFVQNELASFYSEYNPFCSAQLFEMPGEKEIRPDTKVDGAGRVTWNGSAELTGSSSDTTKRILRIVAWYRRESLTKSVYTDVKLGYKQHEHDNPTNWEKWVNLVEKNVDAGIFWYIGIPYVWWYGMDADEFIRHLGGHIDRPDEPLWNTTAPSLNLQATKCPVCKTFIGFTSLGTDRRCPICKFVIGWTGIPVKTAWKLGKLEVYAEKPSITLEQNLMMFR